MFQVRPDILEISKALGEDTRFSIFCEIAQAETPLTVKDLVAIFGMHHSAIRIHLNRLEEAGLIVSQKRHTKGAVGRPQLAFLPNPDALSITLPPRDYQFMAQLALDFAVAQDGDGVERAEEFASNWGRTYMQAHRSGAKLSFEEALEATCNELHQLGGVADWARENGGGTFLLTERNCPFAELPHDHDHLICAMHQAVAQGMLCEAADDDFTWEQMTSMRQGAYACLTRVALTGRDDLLLEV